MSRPGLWCAGLLEPLPIGALNFRERLDGLLSAMSADILGRVLGDKLEEDRYISGGNTPRFVKAACAHCFSKHSQAIAAVYVWPKCNGASAMLLCMYMRKLFEFGVSCRWPQKLELQMRAFRNSDRKSKTAVRSCAFPSPSLMESAGSSGPVNAETGTGKTMLRSGILAFCTEFYLHSSL